MKYTDIKGKKLSGMTIGTVQLGMNYGIANEGGKPDEEKSFSMLRTALENGVTSIDTARVYGDSEEVIGRFLRTWEGEPPYITTKIRKLEGDSAGEIEKFVVSETETSLARLGVDKVNNVILHVAGDIAAYGRAGAEAMYSLVRRGYTDSVGASVYGAAEVEEMLKYPEYTSTQIPMSIFDQRLINSGTVEKLREREITVFVRSVFLQGLFFLDPDKLEDPILIEHASSGIRLLRSLAASEGMSVAQLAIAFMRDAAGVTSLVLGADTPEQVACNIAYFDAPSLSETTLSRIRTEFERVDIPEIMKVLSRSKKQ